MNIPREIYQLVDYLNRNGMKTPHLFTTDRKYASNPLINDIRDWLNVWSTTDFRKYFLHYRLDPIQILNIFFPFSSAGTPQTGAEALLMLLESPPEPLASPLEEECLYAESFDKCCEIIRILPGPKKNVFLYICMFLNELLKYNQLNRLDAVKLCKFIIHYS